MSTRRITARALAALGVLLGAACGPPGLAGAGAADGGGPTWDASVSGGQDPRDDGAAGGGGAIDGPDAVATTGGEGTGALDPIPLPPDRDDPVYTWSEFIATAADENGLPSLLDAEDSRAGSVEINFNGWWDVHGAASDTPYESAIVTLRNGASDILEQWHVNRTSPPGVHATGCNPERAWPECFVEAPEAVVGGVLAVGVPEKAATSNDRFDSSGLRVRISGRATLDYDPPPPWKSNAHETMRLTWEAPLGIETAQVQLRGRYDRGLDGLDEHGDPMIDIVRRNVPPHDDLLPPFVTVVEETPTRLTLEVPAYEALKWVQEAYAP